MNSIRRDVWIQGVWRLRNGKEARHAPDPKEALHPSDPETDVFIYSCHGAQGSSFFAASGFAASGSAAASSSSFASSGFTAATPRPSPGFKPLVAMSYLMYSNHGHMAHQSSRVTVSLLKQTSFNSL